MLRYPGTSESRKLDLPGERGQESIEFREPNKSWTAGAIVTEGGAAACNRTPRRGVVGEETSPPSLPPAIFPLAKPNQKLVSKGSGRGAVIQPGHRAGQDLGGGVERQIENSQYIFYVPSLCILSNVHNNFIS